MRLTHSTSTASVTGSRAPLPIGVTVTTRFTSRTLARPAGTSTVTWLAVPPWPEMVNVLVSPVKLKTVARPALVKVPALVPVGVYAMLSLRDVPLTSRELPAVFRLAVTTPISATMPP